MNLIGRDSHVSPDIAEALKLIEQSGLPFQLEDQEDSKNMIRRNRTAAHFDRNNNKGLLFVSDPGGKSLCR
jgi:hypothetical protein